MLKTSVELLCHSNERVNDLFCMCFVHGSEHEFASVYIVLLLISNSMFSCNLERQTLVNFSKISKTLMF